MNARRKSYPHQPNFKQRLTETVVIAEDHLARFCHKPYHQTAHIHTIVQALQQHHLPSRLATPLQDFLTGLVQALQLPTMT